MLLGQCHTHSHTLTKTKHTIIVDHCRASDKQNARFYSTVMLGTAAGRVRHRLAALPRSKFAMTYLSIGFRNAFLRVCWVGEKGQFAKHRACV